MNPTLKSHLYLKIEEWLDEAVNRDDLTPGAVYIHPQISKLMVDVCEIVYDASIQTSEYVEKETQ